MTALATEQQPPKLQRRRYGRSGHGYLVDGQKVTGVTAAIGALDKPALRNWYATQAADRAVNEWERLSELPRMERWKYIKEGPRDVVREAGLRGTQIHGLAEKLAHGEEVDVPDEHRGPVEGYARFLDKWEIETLATETPLCNVTYRFGGTADLWARIGKLDGAVALLDPKSGKGVWNEVVLQLSAYRYSEWIQPDAVNEPGLLIPTPVVEHTFVAHVMPDVTRMVPVATSPATFRHFLYVLEAHRGVKGWEELPPVLDAVEPGESW